LAVNGLRARLVLFSAFTSVPEMAQSGVCVSAL